MDQMMMLIEEKYILDFEPGEVGMLNSFNHGDSLGR
jgi:hypothetical protein